MRRLKYGVHIAHNVGDKLPHDDKPIYIAVCGNYFGIGICPLNALLTLKINPRKLIRANSKLWIGAAEQPEIKNKLVKLWITIILNLWKH